MSAGSFFDVDVSLLDDGGETVPGPVEGSVSILLEGSIGELEGTASAIVEAGVAHFVKLRIKRAAPALVLVAQYEVLVGKSDPFAIVPGGAVKITLITAPQATWDLGVYFSPPPTVEASDVFGNVASASGELITAEIVAGQEVFRTYGVATRALDRGRAAFDHLGILAEPSSEGSLTLRFSLSPSQNLSATVAIEKPDIEWTRVPLKKRQDTGLVWAEAPILMQTATDAAVVCAAMPLQDGFGWRLTTYVEATSLLENETPPLLSFTLTETTIRTRTGSFGLDLAAGTSAFVADTELLTALCLLDTAAAAPAPSRSDASPTGHFELYLNGAEAVKDNRTQLIWQRSDVTCTACSWTDAKAACEGLDAAEITDWRLPTARELATILAIRAGPPRWDGQVFQGGQGHYWTSTVAASGHLSIDFSTGLIISDADVSPRHLRCVR